MHLLPIFQESNPLRRLAPEIDEMAREQQVIPRRHSHRIAHERRRIERQGGGHAAGDASCGVQVSASACARETIATGAASQIMKQNEKNVQFGIFFEIRYGGEWDTEVGRWAPEIYVCAEGQWVLQS